MLDELDAIVDFHPHGPFVIDCPTCEGVGCEECEFIGVIEDD